MSLTIRQTRSNTANARPTAANAQVGTLYLNFNSKSPGLVWRTSATTASLSTSGTPQVLGQYDPIQPSPLPGDMYFRTNRLDTGNFLNVWNGTAWKPAAPFLNGLTTDDTLTIAPSSTFLGNSTGYQEAGGTPENSAGNTGVGYKSLDWSTWVTKCTSVGSNSGRTGNSSKEQTMVLSTSLGYNSGNSFGMGQAQTPSTAGSVVAIGYRESSSFRADGHIVIGSNSTSTRWSGYWEGTNITQFSSTPTLAIGVNCFNNSASLDPNRGFGGSACVIGHGSLTGLYAYASSSTISGIGGITVVGNKSLIKNAGNPGLTTIGYGVWQDYRGDNRYNRAIYVGNSTPGGSSPTYNDVCFGSYVGTYAYGSKPSVMIGYGLNSSQVYRSSVVIGSHAAPDATPARENFVVLSTGGITSTATVKFSANNSGAWAYNTTDYGLAGQVLFSQGSDLPPIWKSLASGTFMIDPNTTAVVEDGVITQII